MSFPRMKLWYFVPLLFMYWSAFYFVHRYPELDKKTKGTVKRSTGNVHLFDKEIISNNSKNLITVRDKAGNIILSRSTDKLSEPLAKWKPREELLYFYSHWKSRRYII